MGQIDLATYISVSSYKRLAIIILLTFTIRLLIILIAHYSERFLIKKFLRRLKQLLKNGDETAVDSLKEKMIPQKDNSSSIERVLSFHSYRIYPYLKEELFALIGKAGNVSDKYSMAPDFQSFSEGIERKLSVRSNKIKFSVFFLLSGALILFFDQLKPIVDSGIAGKYTISFFQFIFLDLGEVIVGTGAFLVIIFFLSLIGHFSIKKESNLIIDETENIISTVYKIKAKEE